MLLHSAYRIKEKPSLLLNINCRYGDITVGTFRLDTANVDYYFV